MCGRSSTSSGRDHSFEDVSQPQAAWQFFDCRIFGVGLLNSLKQFVSLVFLPQSHLGLDQSELAGKPIGLNLQCRRE